MHIKSGIYAFLPMFEILPREDLNFGDVWEGLGVGSKHKNCWCKDNRSGLVLRSMEGDL